jgi:hypothetical protein
MAAVLPFLETEPSTSEFEELRRSLQGFGDSPQSSGLPPLAKSNAELMNLMWIRESIIRELSVRKMWVERQPMPHLHPQAALYYIHIDPPLPGDTVPWWGTSGNKPKEGTPFFSTNTKMACPTFDLPAGAPTMGGTCPGATAGQTVVPASIRNAAMPAALAVSQRFNLLTQRVENTPEDRGSAICQTCYATGGTFQYATTQMSELIRFGFVKRMVEQNPEALAQMLYEGVLGAEGHFDAGNDATNRFGFLPVRVHSSGDFFSTAYAQVWLNVAWMLLANERNGGRAVRLWAPTRTQAAGWQTFWSRARVPMNFAIRPSAWHVGDMSPQPVARLYDFKPKQGTYVAGVDEITEYRNAADQQVVVQGTTVFRPDDIPAQMGKSFDFQCQTYGLEKGDKTCSIASPPAGAAGPNGVRPDSSTVGCRTCWIRPDLRVNYALH